MFRTIVQWLIDRAAKRDAPLPAWLRRYVDRDQQLLRYEAISRSLDERLRTGAELWMAGRQLDLRPHTSLAHNARRIPHKRSVRTMASACALAASMLLALAWWLSQRGRAPLPEYPQTAPVIAKNDELSTLLSDRELLVAMWQVGREHVGSWRVHLDAGARPLAGLHWEASPKFIPTLKSVDAAPRRLRAAIDQTVQSQTRELTAGMKSAYSFFAHRLPASLAVVVGLQDG